MIIEFNAFDQTIDLYKEREKAILLSIEQEGLN